MLSFLSIYIYRPYAIGAAQKMTDLMTDSIREKFESTQAPGNLEKGQDGYANPTVNRDWEVWMRAWEAFRQSKSSAPITVNPNSILTPQEVEFVKNVFNTSSSS